MTTHPLDQYENALVQYLKRSVGSYPRSTHDLLLIWAWRNEVPVVAIPLSHLAECMYELADRCGLLGMSFALPGASGAVGVMIDAAPCRHWVTMPMQLPPQNVHSTNPDYLYWSRIISVLASRLCLAPVDKLPGYSGDAEAGPFGVKSS